MKEFTLGNIPCVNKVDEHSNDLETSASTESSVVRVLFEC